MTTSERKRAGRAALGEKPDLLLGLLRQMLLIRRFEEKAAEMYTKGKIRGFLHLYVGEEATGVGAVSALQEQDYVVSHYREHGHALARGMQPERVMAELYGRVDGVSGGRGGSMHLYDVSRGFMGGYAIVGGHLPIAAGLGLASQVKRKYAVVLCIFGDGAVNQGEFWETLNLTALWKLPVVFLLENNGFAMGTAQARASAGGPLHERAEPFGIPHEQINGMDVLEVRERLLHAVEHARSGKGPYFVEAMTYRYRGHSMADPELYRDKDQIAPWRERDPIGTFATALSEAGVLSQDQFDAMKQEVEAEVQAAADFAENSPKPELASLHDHVYTGDA